MDRPGSDLIPTGSLQSGTAALQACSKELKRLLLDGGEPRLAIRDIAANRAMREEAAQIAEALNASARAATPMEIMKVLIRHAPEFGIQARSSKEWDTLFSSYLDILSSVPLEALEDAFLRWGRGELYPKDIGRHTFFPKAPELHKLAEPMAHQLRKAAWRAKQAAEMADVTPKPKDTRSGAEKRAELIRMGVLTEDGRVNLAPKSDAMKPPAAPSQSPNQVAEALRAKAQETEEEGV